MASHVRVKRLRRSTATALVATTITVGVIGVGTSYASTESSYLAILNQERTSHGLSPLHPSADLTAVADAWAARMAGSRWLRHNPALTSQVHNWESVGENVGDGADLRDLADAFWASTSHRDNILDPDYTQVGVGAVFADRRIWIAVVFREPLQRAVSSSQQRGASRTSEQSSRGRRLTLGITGSAGVFGALTQHGRMVSTALMRAEA